MASRKNLILRAWPGMSGDKSRSCETAGEEAQIGQVDPGSFAGDGCLKVFREATAAAKPSYAPPPSAAGGVESL
jgi:hypothetical protein